MIVRFTLQQRIVFASALAGLAVCPACSEPRLRSKLIPSENEVDASAVPLSRDATAGVPASHRVDASTVEMSDASTGTAPCQPPAIAQAVGWATVGGEGREETTGGGDREAVRVSTLAEFQSAVTGDESRVIYVQGVLDAGNVQIGSNKTIAGVCGAEVHGHLELNGSENVIVRNLTIVGYAEGDCSLDPSFDSSEGCSSGADAVSIQRGAHHIWFDHCVVRDGADGNLDITNGANFVTISWTKFFYTPRVDNQGADSTGGAGHRYSNLVGGTDFPSEFADQSALNVTWHHNWWADNVVERQPRVRFGRNHLFNNLYTSTVANYCVRAGRGARILLEGNSFLSVDDPHEFNSATDEGTAHIEAGTSNVYIGTTSERAVGGGGVPFGDPPYQYEMDSAETVQLLVMNEVGPH